MTGAPDRAVTPELVRDELRALNPAVRGLRSLSTGLEAGVFGARWDDREVVIKAPFRRSIVNDNDPLHDARDLLRKDAALLGHARAAGVPAPEVILLHVEGDVDLLVLELVRGDGSAPGPQALADVLATLHAAPPPSLTTVRQGGPLPDVLAERIVRRAAVVERIAGVKLGLPVPERLASAIAPSAREPSLLHLDIRPENVLTKAGRVVGLIDWTNALVGDPALELARIAEYGSAPPGLFDAYRGRRPLTTSVMRDLIYRLDAAVMLAVVFLSEAPDAARAQPQVARARQLSAQVVAQL